MNRCLDDSYQLIGRFSASAGDNGVDGAIRPLFSIVAIALCAAGCARSKAPSATPYGRGVQAIEGGRIFPGPTVTELIQRSDPVVVTHAGRFKLLHYNEVSNDGGLTVITKDESVTRAYSWDDFSEPRDFFNIMTDEDLAAEPTIAQGQLATLLAPNSGLAVSFVTPADENHNETEEAETGRVQLENADFGGFRESG